MDSAPCGFLNISDTGVITAVNSTLSDWLGYKRDELQGRKLEEIIGIAGRIFYQTHLFPLITLHGKAEEIFLTFKTKHRTDLPVLMNGRRIEHGDTYENHYILMPVFQRRKYEDELLRARKVAEDAVMQNEALKIATSTLEALKSEQDYQVTRLQQMLSDLAKFGKVISHDMQEPARKIAMFADILTREGDNGLAAESQYALKGILKSSHHLRSLISCIEQYVGIDITSEITAECHLAIIIETARQKVLLQRPDLPININCGVLPPVDGYSEQLVALFYHLFDNAVQFKKPEAIEVSIHIEADVFQQNSYRTIKDKYHYVDILRLVISDDGIGFDNEYNDYIFQLFKKAHEDASGLGFGLAYCKKIIEHHGGSISAKSESKNGASFTLMLPVKSLI